MDYPVRIDRRVFVPMEDGTRIALTVYRPDAPSDGPYPAVVESVPYRKDDDCTARDYVTYSHLAARGIAGIRIDIRGTGASTGIIADEYTQQEHEDNLEVMRWAEAQEWCTGALGMWGISWGGFSSLQTAMLRPPQLKAIAAAHATHDRFACDVHYTGGSLHASEQVEWPGGMVTSNALPPDPDIFGDGWREEWMRRLEATPQWPAEWLRHQKRDEYWLHGSPCDDYSAITCPTLLIGGWLDGYVDGMLALAEHLECPTRTVIGPWGHYRPATGVPRPTYDHLDLLARWFGHHLRGDDNGIPEMPAVTLFVRSRPPYDGDEVSGHWTAFDSWPPGDQEEWRLSLDDLAHTRTSWSGPQWVGAHAPAWDRAGMGSIDSGEDDAASMTFETSPLADPVEILGTSEALLRVATDDTVGLVAARLLVVAPDGSSHLLCRGNRNLAFPNDLSHPATPEPGRFVDVVIPLMAASAVIPAGWRLRLALSGADFPVVWPPRRPFTLTIDPAGSSLVLPIRPAAAAGPIIDVPPSPPPPQAPVTQRRSESNWAVDRAGRTTTFTKTKGSSEHQPDRDALTYTYDQRLTVRVDDDDPATLSTYSEAVSSLDRPGWEVSAVGSLRISGAEELRVVVELSATHNGEEIFRRRWDEVVLREWA